MGFGAAGSPSPLERNGLAEGKRLAASGAVFSGTSFRSLTSGVGKYFFSPNASFRFTSRRASGSAASEESEAGGCVDTGWEALLTSILALGSETSC